MMEGQKGCKLASIVHCNFIDVMILFINHFFSCAVSGAGLA